MLGSATSARVNYFYKKKQKFDTVLYKKSMEIVNKENKKVLANVVCEPSLGVERAFLVFMFDAYSQNEKGDIALGKLAAAHKNVTLNLYYTPTKLTENSLIFNKKLMVDWWEQGFNYAKSKNEDTFVMSELKN